MSNPLRHPGPAVPGLALFSTVRLLTPPLQVALLSDGLATSILNSLGFWRVTPAPLVTGLRGLSGYGGLLEYVQRPGGCLVFATSIAVLKHVYWSIFTPNAAFPVPQALGIATYNLLCDSTNALVLAYRLAYHPDGNGILTKSDWKQWLGLSMVIVGTGIEFICEEGRRKWKVKKAGKGKAAKEGKVYDQGLFGVVRHPNYLGYTIWRTGLALTTGSTWNAIIQLVWNVGFFTMGSIPELGGYMKGKYGESYEAYEKKVPYKLIPYIY